MTIKVKLTRVEIDLAITTWVNKRFNVIKGAKTNFCTNEGEVISVEIDCEEKKKTKSTPYYGEGKD